MGKKFPLTFYDGKLYVDLKNTDGKEEEKIISTDSVVLCVGYASENSLYDELKYDVSNLYKIGDAEKVSNIIYAIWDAFEVANHIE